MVFEYEVLIAKYRHCRVTKLVLILGASRGQQVAELDTESRFQSPITRRAFETGEIC